MVHLMESRMCSCDKVSNYRSTGVTDYDTIQDGIYLNLGDPSYSYESEYLKARYQEQGLEEDTMEFGLIHSARNMGKSNIHGESNISLV